MPAPSSRPSGKPTSRVSRRSKRSSRPREPIDGRPRAAVAFDHGSESLHVARGVQETRGQKRGFVLDGAQAKASQHQESQAPSFAAAHQKREVSQAPSPPLTESRAST